MRILIVLNVFIVGILMLASCSRKENKDQNDRKAIYKYQLNKSSKSLSFEIASDIDYWLPALFPFEDSEGNEYLTFQNGVKNEILFYNMNPTDFLFKLYFDPEGPNGIGRFMGYHIKDLDEIYLTIPGRTVIAQMDSSGRLLQKINYDKTDEGEPIIPFYFSNSNIYTPLIIIDNKLYFTQMPNWSLTLTTSPVCGYIDTLNQSVEMLPFYYPAIMEDDKSDIYAMGSEFDFSRIYDETQFIYSFHFNENIYIASTDHKKVDIIPVKSKYINKIYIPEKRPDEAIQGMKKLCEIPVYGNLLYDKYRNVYYRIAYPETEIGSDENYVELFRNGRKNFSIIILDKDFNIIGETLFPDYTYISNCMFVNKDGLYIRSNHYKSPDFNEDVLSFACFELVQD